MHVMPVHGWALVVNTLTEAPSLLVTWDARRIPVAKSESERVATRRSQG
jgi:hypothetical protein